MALPTSNIFLLSGLWASFFLPSIPSTTHRNFNITNRSREFTLLKLSNPCWWKGLYTWAWDSRNTYPWSEIDFKAVVDKFLVWFGFVNLLRNQSSHLFPSERKPKESISLFQEMVWKRSSLSFSSLSFSTSPSPLPFLWNTFGYQSCGGLIRRLRNTLCQFVGLPPQLSNPCWWKGINIPGLGTAEIRIRGVK